MIMLRYLLRSILKHLVVCILWFGEVNSQWPKDCSPKEGIPCHLYFFKDTNCSQPYLKEKFPNIYEAKPFSCPGGPGSLNSTAARYRQYSNIVDWYPEVNLTFTTPQHAGINYVRGFLVERVDAVFSPACYILDLSNVTWKAEDMNTIFHLDMFPIPKIKGQPVYTHFKLYALPLPDDRDAKYDKYLQLYIEFPKEYDPSPRPENWRATIYYVANENDGKINVAISPPPAEFGFTEFEYSLYDVNADSIYKTPVYSSKTTHIFDKVETGKYKIWVKPKGPGYVTTQTVEFQFNYSGPPEMTTTTTMATTTIPPTTVTTLVPPDVTAKTSAETDSGVLTTPTSEATSSLPVTSSIPVVSEAESNTMSTEKVVAAAVGALFGVALVVGLGVFVFFCRSKKAEEKTLHEQDDDFPSMAGKNPGFEDIKSVFSEIEHFNNVSASKKRFESRAKVFLLYEDDNEYHRNVVLQFATYLQQHCQCDVMCAEWQLDSPWVHQEFQQAKFVVVVNSEGAYTSYMNKSLEKNSVSSSPTTRRMSSINSIRNTFLQDERYDKYVMVYFEYTDEKFVIPNICPGYKYKLPKHFTDFLLHIHSLKRTDNLSQYDLPLDGNHNVRPIGQKFLEAVNKAKEFQSGNPNWSQRKYGFTRMCSHVSDDSRYDSGLPEDSGSPLQTPERIDSFPENPIQAHLRHLLSDGQSVLTVTPSDVGLVLDYGSQKPRPKFSPESFTKNSENLQCNNPQTPSTCGTLDSKFSFLPPDDLDDNFDVTSRSQSEQMQNFVDRYELMVKAAQENVEKSGIRHKAVIAEESYQNDFDFREGYNRSNDLYLLRVHSGEIACNGDVISLGGESV